MAKADSEEEDYMSDAFLASLEDKKPGLAWGKQAREHQNERKIQKTNKESKTKPKKVIEHEKREEGLQKSIGSENRGFALLSKMGYKPGMAIGKRGTGIKEPVTIQLKSGRGGLGEEAEKKRRQDEMSAMRARMSVKRQRLEGRRKEEFSASMRDKFNMREIEQDLYKSQRVCEHLESEQGIKKPDRSFFWPQNTLQPGKEREQEEDLYLRGGYSAEVRELDTSSSSSEDEIEEEDGDNGISSAEKLEILTSHLRSTFYYCVWCGTTYDDAEDMQSNCPGNNAEAHR